MNILIYGKGDFAKLILTYLNDDEQYNVIGFCADSKYVDGPEYLGYPLYNIDQVSEFIDVESTGFFIAVGYSSMSARKMMFDKVATKGYRLINIYCRGSNIHHTVETGVNNIFMPQTLIEPFSKIGNNNIFWSSSLICHDTEVKDHNFFASQSIVGGFTKIGSCNFFGFKSTVVDNLTVDNFIVLGASSTLLSNALQEGKYFGIPAKLYNKEK